MLIIGSHMDLVGPKYLLGAVTKAIANKANALMVYTGAPQNTIRKDISLFHVEEAHALLKENNIALDNIIIHAPYIINLGNCDKEETFQLGIRVLIDEIKRVKQIGAKYLVLHPGSCLKAGVENGINRIAEGLNAAITDGQEVIILLETMAGKGSEVGACFEEIAAIINKVKLNQYVGVCMDTCHLHDAGYDLNNFDSLLDEFDEIIGLERLKCIHINDSKNIKGAHKDRHENIGYGMIGFDTLCKIVHHPRLDNIPKILETPYINGEIAPYAMEIKMLKEKKFSNEWIDIKANIVALEE